MRKMVQGTEHEYTLYCRKMGTMGFDPHMMALDLLRDSDLHLAGEFITNGSRVYYDVGHFEVSTAETTNFHDVVVWEKAGEKILDWLRRVMEEKYTGDMKIHAFKNNTSPDGTSYGSHENYCVSRDVPFPGQYLRDLVPHLATRFIYTGAGDILRGKYVLSPMAFLTSQVISGETMHDTGILNTRDEPHADGRVWRRLHVIGRAPVDGGRSTGRRAEAQGPDSGRLAQRGAPEPGAVEGRARGWPDRLADRRPALLPREDRDDRAGRLGTARDADVRGGPQRTGRPPLERSRPAHRVARPVLRDSGGRGEEGRTGGRDDGVQAVLGNWCGAIVVLQAPAGGPRRTHDGRRCYQKGNSRTAERHPRSPSSGTMRHLQYRDD